jgi:hypothetical protein
VAQAGGEQLSRVGVRSTGAEGAGGGFGGRGGRKGGRVGRGFGRWYPRISTGPSSPHSRQAGVTRRQFNSGRPGSSIVSAGYE